MTAWLGAEIAGAVANGVVEGVALSVLLWLLLRLTPKAAAATRYALCGLALAFVAVLPMAPLPLANSAGCSRNRRAISVGQYQAPRSISSGCKVNGPSDSSR